MRLAVRISALALVGTTSASVAQAPSPGNAPAELRARIAAVLELQSASVHWSTPDHGAPQALRALYTRTADAPLWSHAGDLTPQAQALLRELGAAQTYGLHAADYAVAAPVGTTSPTNWAAFDVQLTTAALKFVSNLHYGRVNPVAAGFKLEAPHEEIDLAASIDAIAHAKDVHAALAALEPPFLHYRLLKAALPNYLELAQRKGLTDLPQPPAHLRVGDHYQGAQGLRSLLEALGDLPRATAPSGAAAELDSSPTYDAALSAAINAFQLRHGLTADGLLGKSTFAALTTPMARRVRQIELTLERWRWLPPFKTPPIIVNIPQFRLYAFRTTGDRLADILPLDVIVGQTFPHAQTPVFEADMKYVVFRPYWDVPADITVREMLPQIRKHPHYLESQHLELVRGQADSSPVVPPTPENLDALAHGQLRLRQQPGPDNALGLIKFILPNDYSVYLHSTPAHQLFQRARRTFSHGCIRVSDPIALAMLVLKHADGDWTREKIEAAMNATADNQRVYLKTPINVLIVYGTALATEAGPVFFFDDIYGYDRRLERQLGGR